MAYKHGVYVKETATGIIAPRSVDSALPFVVGTAPIHLAGNGLNASAQTQVPVLCSNMEEAALKLGFSEDFEKYTLCELMDLFFNVYNKAPLIFVNVLDPAVHKTSVAQASYMVLSSQAILGEDVILDSVVVQASESGEALVAGVDYSLGWNSAGKAVLNVLTGGTLAGATEIYAAFDRLDPSLVASSDIIGGYNAQTQRTEGLELIGQCFPKFGKVPSIIAVPKWSENLVVGAVMTAKAESISGLFRAIAVTDIPSGADGIEDYTEVNEWKRGNSYTDGNQIACWPMGKLGDKVYHLSSIIAGMMAVTDAEYDDIPYASPSNKLTKMTAAVTKSGKEILLDISQANYLNENGIATLLNWESGWMSWGDDMACYPSNTDPKDRFINVRRFYNWYAAKFILRWFFKVDSPLNRRLLETIQDSENIQINAYVAQGVLVGNSNGLTFRAADNPQTDLVDGVIRAHTKLTVPPPARVIENTLEYDPEELLTLFV